MSKLDEARIDNVTGIRVSLNIYINAAEGEAAKIGDRIVDAMREIYERAIRANIATRGKDYV